MVVKFIILLMFVQRGCSLFTLNGNFTQLKGIHKDGISTGPILIINKRVFYITNIQSTGKCENAVFWVGVGNTPDKNGQVIYNEEEQVAIVNQYLGRSEYFKLKQGLSIENIQYIGVWSRSTNKSCGWVNLPQNAAYPEYNNFYKEREDDVPIVRLPKCCSLENYFVRGNDTLIDCGKRPSNDISAEFNILRHNDTHVDDKPLNSDNYLIVPFEHNGCQKESYMVEDSDYDILQNGSLVLFYVKQHIQNIDDFCIELFKDVEEKYFIFHCYQDHPILPSGIIKGYEIALIISVILVISTVICYAATPDLHEPIGWNVVGYSSSMIIYIILLLVAITSDDYIPSLGRAYHSILLISLIWYSLINYELYYMIKFYDKEYSHSNKKRIISYITITMVTFIIATAAHFGSKSNAIMPLYVTRLSNPLSEGTRVLYGLYFVLAVANMLGLIFSQLKITSNNNKKGDASWSIMKNKITGIFRACVTLSILITVSILAELLTHFLEPNNGFLIALNTLHAIQGTFIFLIFTIRKPIKEKISKFWRSECQKRNYGNQNDNTKDADIPLTRIPNDTEYGRK